MEGSMSELAIRFDICGHRFARDFIPNPIVFIGENVDIFADLSNKRYEETSKDILILVSCHGSKRRRGAFRNNDRAYGDEYHVTAQDFWTRLKPHVERLSTKKFVVVFAQCYGGLMAQDVIVLVNDVELLRRISIVGLSDGATIKKTSASQPLGLQTYNKNIIKWLLREVQRRNNWVSGDFEGWFANVNDPNHRGECPSTSALAFLRVTIDDMFEESGDESTD